MLKKELRKLQKKEYIEVKQHHLFFQLVIDLDQPSLRNQKRDYLIQETQTGQHEYAISDGDGSISVSITHKTSKRPQLKKGSLTTSKVNIDLGDNLGSHDALNSVIPAINHHIKAVQPDTIELETNDSTAFHNKVIRGISKKYRVSSTEKEDGTHSWTLQSRKITPRIMSLINSLLKK